MNIRKLLNSFSIRPVETRLFEVLLEEGALSAAELGRQAGVSRTAVYDLVEKLLEVGLIGEILNKGIKKFVVQPPEKIQILIEEKEKKLAEAREQIGELKKIYEHKHTVIKPRLQMFEGRAELQQMMKDLLLYRDITAYAYWPVKKMLALLTPEFMDSFHRERVARNIELKVIWPIGQIHSVQAHHFLGTDSKLKRQARLAPKNIDFTLDYSVYGNTVRFISSSRENFGFLVESAELSDMMRGQFEILWKNSKPLK